MQGLKAVSTSISVSFIGMALLIIIETLSDSFDNCYLVKQTVCPPY